MIVWKVEEAFGETLIDMERNEGEHTASGAKEEVILHLTNGKEILIFVDDDGQLHVEGD